MSDTNTNEQKTVGYNGLEHYDNKIKTYIQDKIDSSGTGGSVTVDNVLSSTSENPVQNKVIKAELDKKAEKSIYDNKSISLGRKKETTVGSYSAAFGLEPSASGDYSLAIGSETEAIGDASFAGGNLTKAEGHFSLAFGEGVETKTNHSAAFGIYNQSNNDTLFSIGNGWEEYDTLTHQYVPKRQNAFEVTITGGKLHDKDIATVDMIPESAIITEDTITGWGFTKNVGTYNKPTDGIPKADLSSDVQASLEKADTALQKHQSLADYVKTTDSRLSDARTPTAHTHDDRYYTESEIDIKLLSKAGTSSATTSSNGLMTKEMVTKLNDIATNANNYIHPTTPGNKHIPSGGSSGQILRWSADGTAAWEDNIANKLTSSSYTILTISTSDWATNSSGGYTCTKTLSSAMAYEHFNFEVVLSSEQASAKLQIESWNYVMADGMITQTTSNGSTTAFTFYAFSTKPTVALTIAIQGVSGS